MKEKILRMNRDQLIDFLIDNWTEFIRTLPTGREKEFFNLHPDLYTKEKLRSIALDLID
jgi:hypothetical protein